LVYSDQGGLFFEGWGMDSQRSCLEESTKRVLVASAVAVHISGQAQAWPP